MSWGDKHKVVLHCHAGCDTHDVMNVLGLSHADLEQTRQIVSKYAYEDEEGNLLYEVLRFEPKGFRQRRPDPERPGKYIWDIKGIEPLPYNLVDIAELVAHGTKDEYIWIVEGEKDVQAMGLAYGDQGTATCNSGGAGHWTDTHSAYFKGCKCRVFIVADRDTAGYKHALSVYESLARVAGIKANLVLPASGKDAANHVKDHGIDSFIAFSPKDMRALVASEEGAKNSAFAKTPSSGNTETSSAPGRVILRAASDIVSRLQRLLWAPRIPVGTLSLFAGRGGVGKSSFALWVAVEAQHGRLPGDLQGEHISVLYVSVEDHWETQMKPRLIAAGANMERFFQLSIGYELDEATGERVPSLPQDTQLIKEAIEQSGAKLVILDPITSTISGDDHKRDVVRAVLDPLALIAGQTDAVILGIMHFNKGIGNASDKLSGSHAFRDAARSVLLFARDEDEDHVVMSQDKGNYAEYGDESLAYRLVDTPVELDDGAIGHVARVVIVGATSTSVSQLINRPQGEDGGVVEWLTSFMLGVGGRVDATTALSTGKAEGFTETQLTRGRKRTRPKIVSRKTGMNGGWEWVSEESAHAEEVPGNSEEGEFLNSDFFGPSSGELSIQRPYDASRVVGNDEQDAQ